MIQRNIKLVHEGINELTPSLELRWVGNVLSEVASKADSQAILVMPGGMSGDGGQRISPVDFTIVGDEEMVTEARFTLANLGSSQTFRVNCWADSTMVNDDLIDLGKSAARVLSRGALGQFVNIINNGYIRGSQGHPSTSFQS
jgi:hypothetical protein